MRNTRLFLMILAALALFGCYDETALTKVAEVAAEKAVSEAVAKMQCQALVDPSVDLSTALTDSRDPFYAALAKLVESKVAGIRCPSAENVVEELMGDRNFLIAIHAPDSDRDGEPDAVDNCVKIANPDQKDGDNDYIGDVCDKCPKKYDEEDQDDQEDSDNDGKGDDCDCDADGDTVIESCEGEGEGCECVVPEGQEEDNCPETANANQADFDDDGHGDACDECPALKEKPATSGEGGAQEDVEAACRIPAPYKAGAKVTIEFHVGMDGDAIAVTPRAPAGTVFVSKSYDTAKKEFVATFRVHGGRTVTVRKPYAEVKDVAGGAEGGTITIADVVVQ